MHFKMFNDQKNCIASSCITMHFHWIMHFEFMIKFVKIVKVKEKIDKNAQVRLQNMLVQVKVELVKGEAIIIILILIIIIIIIIIIIMIMVNTLYNNTMLTLSLCGACFGLTKYLYL